MTMSSTFIRYLGSDFALEDRFRILGNELQINMNSYGALWTFLDLLRLKDQETFEHSLRVCLLGSAMAKLMHLDAKILFYAGALHDIGKAQTNPETLKKTSGWTPADTTEIMNHVMDGYRLLRGQFDFSAEVILWHHRFQPNSYPTIDPTPLHKYSVGTQVMIPLFGRLLALADQFDASHRLNDRFTGPPESVGDWVKQKMFEGNPDQKSLIGAFYDADIFTTKVFLEEPVVAA